MSSPSLLTARQKEFLKKKSEEGLYGLAIRRSGLNMYDDRLYIAEHGKLIVNEMRWNTSPSQRKPKVAELVAYKEARWKPGIHGLSKPPSRRYRAFVQASPVLVFRKNFGYDHGYFGINHHHGLENAVSSLGCQTAHPDDWEDYREKIYDRLDALDQASFGYIVFEEGVDNRDVILKQTIVPYEYYFNGRLIGKEFDLHFNTGRGFVLIRKFIAHMKGVPPETLSFSWDDDDNLVFNGKIIETLEVAEGVTYGSIGDAASAVGATVTFDKKKVNITLKGQ